MYLEYIAPILEEDCIRVMHRRCFVKRNVIKYFRVRSVSEATFEPSPAHDDFDATAFSSTQSELFQATDDAEQKKVGEVLTLNQRQSSIILRVHSYAFDRHYQGFGQKAIGDSYQWPRDGKATDDNEEGRPICEVAARAKVIREETWS